MSISQPAEVCVYIVVAFCLPLLAVLLVVGVADGIVALVSADVGPAAASAVVLGLVAVGVTFGELAC